jgi:hypothetical protein
MEFQNKKIRDHHFAYNFLYEFQNGSAIDINGC